ncbi:MAG: DUF4105 domain-containing protein [Bacteroidales bacterium]|nr:DUF4105 domain-containing protein [Bacteroidales bacterium]
MMTKRFFTYIFMLLAACLSASGQSADSVRVSLVTMYPGSEIYELYGHTELRVQCEQGDYFFNYGLFDFNAPNFVYRFVKGETDYLCGAIPAAFALRGYEGRRVVEQELNLTAAQASAMRDMLFANARPENATYRYKFVSDNCATRPRDIIEKALAGSLTYHPADSANVTYRQMMHRYNANYAWNRLGIDLALGADLDTAITFRQRMFAPVVLMDAFAHATVKDSLGHEVPLVKSTLTLVDGVEQGLVLDATPWYLTPLFMACVLLAVVAFVSLRDYKRRRASRWFDTLLFTAFALGGCVVFFLVFVSTHECTSPNYNALWLHPFYVLLAILPWVGKARKTLTMLHGANFVWLMVAGTLVATGMLAQEFAATFYVLMAVAMVRSFSHLMLNLPCNRAAVK